MMTIKENTALFANGKRASSKELEPDVETKSIPSMPQTQDSSIPVCETCTIFGITH